MQYLLEVSDLITLQGKEGVSFSVAPSEIVAIYGRNGAGKSLILKSIFELFKYYSGKISLNIPKGELGACLQFPEHLIFKDTAFGEASIIMQSEEGALKLLDTLKIDPNSKALQLSDGQKRLLFLYGYLLSKRLLIFDEPFVSLDKEHIKRLEENCISAASRGASLLYTANRKSQLKIATKIIYL